MSVIAFRPRATQHHTHPALVHHATVHGSFRAPSGRAGRMTGTLRIRRLVLAPRGALVAGVFTGELREEDGSLVGTDSRRATVPVELVREEGGYRPWARSFTLDLMGIPVEVAPFPLDPTLGATGPDGASRPVGGHLHPRTPPVT